MNEAKKVGMLVIYDNDAGYILVIKHWDSASGKVGGSKYPIAGEFAEGFLRFKRFFFDSTFDKIFLFVVQDIYSFSSVVIFSFVFAFLYCMP